MKILARTVRQQKKIKGLQIGKDFILLLFRDDMRVYINNLKNSITELIQLLDNCSKVSGYKSNSKKSVAFYTNGVMSEKDIRKIMQFTKVINNINYLRVTLTSK